MKITIETIPHKEQRYETVGDWIVKPNGDIEIRVSDLGNAQYNQLVAVHELIEVLLCRHAGISTEAVDDFDKNYELYRLPGDTTEPGDAEKSPYRDQHCFATGIERLLASQLDVSWKEYEDTINAL